MEGMIQFQHFMNSLSQEVRVALLIVLETMIFSALFLQYAHGSYNRAYNRAIEEDPDRIANRFHNGQLLGYEFRMNKWWAVYTARDTADNKVLVRLKPDGSIHRYSTHSTNLRLIGTRPDVFPEGDLWARRR